MATRVITITGSNTTTEELTLPNRGHTKVRPGDTIMWHIGPHSGVHSITLIEEKKNSTDIFAIDPHQDGPHWTGEISRDAKDYDTYRYSIYWKASQSSREYKHDPKISIRPSTLHDVIVKTAIALVAAALCIVTVKMMKERSGK